MDWSDLSRIPTNALKRELEFFDISTSPYRASVLRDEIERRALIDDALAHRELRERIGALAKEWDSTVTISMDETRIGLLKKCAARLREIGASR